MPRVPLSNPADSISELSAKHTEHRTAIGDLLTDGTRTLLKNLRRSLGPNNA